MHSDKNFAYTQRLWKSDNYAMNCILGDNYLPSNFSEAFKQELVFYFICQKCVKSLDLVHCHEKYFIHVIAFGQLYSVLYYNGPINCWIYCLLNMTLPWKIWCIEKERLEYINLFWQGTLNFDLIQVTFVRNKSELNLEVKVEVNSRAVWWSLCWL